MIGYLENIKDLKSLKISNEEIINAIMQVNQPIYLLEYQDKLAVSLDGIAKIGDLDILKSQNRKNQDNQDFIKILGYCPALNIKQLGDNNFKKKYNLNYAYVIGDMAHGITSVDMIKEASRAGMLSFYGSAGLLPDYIEQKIIELKQKVKNLNFGFNLINSPSEPELETALVELYLKHEIKLISASAYMDISLPLVYFRVKNIYENQEGKVICPNKIIAKVSRAELALKFFSPPPQKLLNWLVEKNKITQKQAELAKFIPMAEDLTTEADSGGHTDNRPAICLFPVIINLKNECLKKFNYDKIMGHKVLSVGLAGGIATPESACCAFAMGANYILTGSVNQACIESGTSDIARQMLSEAKQADVAMAPCADMFEMGVKVQVLKRKTMFAQRAAKLYDLYSKLNSLEDISQKDKLILERDFFKKPIDSEWQNTKEFFLKRDPKQIEKAQKNPKHKMALIFRSYIGQASKWAVTGDLNRIIDYQIWTGPSIGAFNEWTKNSFLENPKNRRVVEVGLNILYGASVLTRLNFLKSQLNQANSLNFTNFELPNLEIKPIEINKMKNFGVDF